MRYLSEAYKQAMEQPVLPPTMLRITFQILDENVTKNAVFTDNGHLYSTIQSAARGRLAPDRYGTLEPDFFLLDGSKTFPPQSMEQDAYVSSMMSFSYGELVIPQKIDIRLDGLRSLAGITYTFDEADNSYPTLIETYAYCNNELITSFVSSPSSPRHLDEIHMQNVNRLEIVFLKMNRENRRLRIAQILLGLQKEYTQSDVSNVSVTWEVSPVNNSLPSAELKFTVNNFDRNYNPDNPYGIYPFLEQNQNISLQIGTETDSGVYWLDCGRFRSTGGVSVDGNYATFEAKDPIQSATTMYKRVRYYEQGTNLYDLALDVLRDMGTSDYQISNKLKNRWTLGYLPLVSHREALQLIAAAGCCTLRTDDNGAILIGELPDAPAAEDYMIDFTKLEVEPEVEKIEPLGTISVKYYTGYSAKSEKKSLGGVAGRHYQSFSEWVDYDKSINHMVFVMDEGVEKKDVHYETYLYGADFWVENPFGLVETYVEGYDFDLISSSVQMQAEKTGESVEYDNPLIGSREQAQDVAIWMSGYLRQRNRYKLKVRQDYRLCVGDIVYFRSQFTDKMRGRVTRIAFSEPAHIGEIEVVVL